MYRNKHLALTVLILFTVNTLAGSPRPRGNVLSPKSLLPGKTHIVFFQPPMKPYFRLTRNVFTISNRELPFWDSYVADPQRYPEIREAFRRSDRILEKRGIEGGLSALIEKPELRIRGAIRLADHSREVARYWVSQILFVQGLVKHLEKTRNPDISSVTFFSGGMIAALYATGAASYESVPLAIDFYSEYFKRAIEIGSRYSIYSTSFKVEGPERTLRRLFKKMRFTLSKTVPKESLRPALNSLEKAENVIRDSYRENARLSEEELDALFAGVKESARSAGADLSPLVESVKQTVFDSQNPLEHIESLAGRIRAEMEEMHARERQVWLKEIRHDRVFVSGTLADLYRYLLERRTDKIRGRYLGNRNPATFFSYLAARTALFLKNAAFTAGFLWWNASVNRMVDALDRVGLGTLGFLFKTLHIAFFVSRVCPVKIIPVFQAEHLPILWEKSPRLKAIVEEVIENNYITTPRWPIFNTGNSHLLPSLTGEKENFTAREIRSFFRDALFREIDMVGAFKTAYERSPIEQILSVSPSKRFDRSLHMNELAHTVNRRPVVSRADPVEDVLFPAPFTPVAAARARQLSAASA